QPERTHVAVVPQPCGDVRVLVALRVDGAVLRAHRGPAALCLHAAMTRLRPWLLDAESGAVRHLVEAVAQRLRSDAHGLEQHVVAGIARAHASSSRLRSAMNARISASTPSSIPGSS